MMVGMQTLDASRSEDVYLHLDEQIDEASGTVLCYSRLPMRQLLRYVSTNTAEMWWLSEHETSRAIAPDPATVHDHIEANTRETTALVVLEGIDWLVRRSDEATVLSMLQGLDGLTKERGFNLILAGDSLALRPTFWARMCSLAPKLHVPPSDAEATTSHNELEPSTFDQTTTLSENEGLDDTVLVHLVNLPRHGFTHAVLARRMLQWKRMGFDLAALEPAMATPQMEKAHAIYSDVENDIMTAIDSLRLMEQQREKFSVTERERFNYRFMALNGVSEASEELLQLVSSR
jgi:hypothetical protein